MEHTQFVGLDIHKERISIAVAHRDKAKQHRPWPRVPVTDDGWRQAIDQLAAGHLTLLGLWAMK